MNKNIVAWKSPEGRFSLTRNEADALSPHPSGEDGVSAFKESVTVHENGAGTEALTSVGCECGGYTNLRDCWDSLWNGTAIPSCLC